MEKGCADMVYIFQIIIDKYRQYCITGIILKYHVWFFFRNNNNNNNNNTNNNNNNNNKVKNVSEDVKMEFGLDKCANTSSKRGKKVLAEAILLNDNQVIQDLDQAETCKYLGIEEGERGPTPQNEGQDQERV